MLYHLLYPLRTQVSGFNVVRYITFRTAVASLTALFLVLILGPWMIERLRRLQVGQYIREEGPQAHQSKKGTPTMGGLLILAGIVIPTLLWADLTNRNVWIAILSTIAFGAIGFADDYLKVVKKQNLGLTRPEQALLPAHHRLHHRAWPSTCSRASIPPPTRRASSSPSSRRLMPDLGLLYIPFAVLVRGVRLQRGEPHRRPGRPGHRHHPHRRRRLHRAHLRERPRASSRDYLDLLYLPRVGELTIFCGAMVGASMGFLWWNCYPGADLHGRRGQPEPGRRAGHGGHPHQAGAAARGHRRAVRDRGLLRDPAGRLLQAARQADLPHGPPAPPLRAHGLEGAAGHGALLDRGLHLRAASASRR